MTIRYYMCILGFGVAFIQLLKGDYIGAMGSLLFGLVFLVNILYRKVHRNEDNDQEEEYDPDDDYF